MAAAMAERPTTPRGIAGYPVRVYVEARHNVRASVGARAVHIRVPRHLGSLERERAIARMVRWAQRTVAERRMTPLPSWPTLADGQRLEVDGQALTLRIVQARRRTATARLEGPVVDVVVPSGLPPADRARALTLAVSRCLAAQWLPTVRRLVDEANAALFGESVAAVRLKYLRASWGSCSRRGTINLSTRLLFAPRPVLLYVCIHELAHLRVRGHGPAFWAQVERAMPRWREHAQWLKRNGHRLPF
jgi:predicted metal-dependent hydrolase